mmetsp:Transcript_42973/g.130795  ORF Transcript_42973/g.130795 Transcript_42973/m.130795 type:complete len:226 (+) Transcript_42973:262-939(+)
MRLRRFFGMDEIAIGAVRSDAVRSRQSVSRSSGRSGIGELGFERGGISPLRRSPLVPVRFHPPPPCTGVERTVDPSIPSLLLLPSETRDPRPGIVRSPVRRPVRHCHVGQRVPAPYVVAGRPSSMLVSRLSIEGGFGRHSGQGGDEGVFRRQQQSSSLRRDARDCLFEGEQGRQGCRRRPRPPSPHHAQPLPRPIELCHGGRPRRRGHSVHLRRRRHRLRRLFLL